MENIVKLGEVVMNKKLVDFDIPIYISEEIDEYINDCKNGNCRYMKWENIKALIRPCCRK